MSECVKVSTIIEVAEGCPIECRVGSDRHVDFTCGGHTDGVELAFDRTALQRFLVLAADALARVFDPTAPEELPVLTSRMDVGA